METTGPWYMAVTFSSITAIYHNHTVHSGQTVVYTVYSTGGAFDSLARHSTSKINIVVCLSVRYGRSAETI